MRGYARQTRAGRKEASKWQGQVATCPSDSPILDNSWSFLYHYLIGNKIDSFSSCRPKAGEVDIAFRTRKLEKTLNSESELQKAYDGRMAERLKSRLAVLKNARTLADVPSTPPERCHPLKAKREGQYAVDLVHPQRLVFKPNHDPVPRMDDGGIDLNKVTSIIIIEVVDYH